MNILAIDTSTASTSVAAINEKGLIAEITVNRKQTHSEKLIELIEVMMKRASMKIGDIDLFACTIGPGSFTGLRIGAAAVKGLAQVFNKEIVGVSTLELMAYSVPAQDELVCPMLDAQRDQVYSGLYVWKNGQLSNQLPEGIYQADELVESLKELEDKVLFVGEGVKKVKADTFMKYSKKFIAVPEVFNTPRSSFLGGLALEKYRQSIQIFSYDEFEPEYFRKSEAEIQFEKKNSRE
ncbi:MAG: tRNA (adenosine(37)-N6)-threonylcarbamoyltransferase complex dimerization subunit type 1 TsaB [Eubacteriaceae bacterium]|nr:tRNA (adenosine(37)-N6)-threonylcarbamoyltransferase complex dimerization subunit type 1 TsaB [Eubacteriaceae bacterium]